MLSSSREVFSIPHYQRTYAWGEKQLNEFFEDLYYLKEGRNYFLGTILLQQTEEEHGPYEVIHVVDGQQRLTTAIVFIKCLLEQCPTLDAEKAKVYRETYLGTAEYPKLMVILQDRDYFNKYISGNIDGKPFINSPSQRRLYEAKRHLGEQIAEITEDERISLLRKLDKHTRILTYSVEDPTEATLIFETNNDRGKDLTNLEKIKTFLMHKVYLAKAQHPKPMIEKIRERFTRIYEEMEHFNGKLDEDSVLQYHFIAFEKWGDKEEYQRVTDTLKKRLNIFLRAGQDREIIEFVERFTVELVETFRIVRNIFDSNHSKVRDLLIVNRLRNVWPTLIKSYKLDQNNDKKEFYFIVDLLEKFCFRAYGIEQRRSHTGQSELYRNTRDFKGDFENLKKLIYWLLDIHTHRFDDFLNYGDMYNWIATNDLNYLFWKYENHLRIHFQPVGPALAEEEFLNRGTRTRQTIEHILSQSEANQNKAESEVATDEKYLGQLNKEFRDNYLHHIGNLTIDPKSANSSKGAKPVEEKNSRYFVKAPLKIQNELEEFMDGEKWTKVSVEQRGQKLIAFAVKYWAY